jgi:2-C-methyl-D-erythritol 2,4-cyclodiphosphate synthase
MIPRVGLGYDVHRFAGNRRLILGGVEIPHPVGLEGHSDADVLLHAIMDAMAGAVALGDIGRHFPDTDPQYRGISSLVLLRHVGNLLAQSGYRVVNIDATLILERPKIAPYVEAMRTTIADALAISADQVSVKATTSEGMGFVGRQEGAAAHAIVAVVSR